LPSLELILNKEVKNNFAFKFYVHGAALARLDSARLTGGLKIFFDPAFSASWRIRRVSSSKIEARGGATDFSPQGLNN